MPRLVSVLCLYVSDRERFCRLDVCPCYTQCYEGCPCSFESEYCNLSCQELHEEAFDDCSNLARAELLACLTVCPPFDLQCEHQCNVIFEEQLAKCPCMEQCADGCPCLYYQCAPDDTTLASTTTSITTTTDYIGTKPTSKSTTTTAMTTTTIPEFYDSIPILTFSHGVS